MTLYAVIFYVLGAIMVASTVLAIIQRYLVNAVAYLIISFFATGLLFYLLGAPFLAALEVIIYAGAIMVLFLFIVMTLRIEQPQRRIMETLGQWLPIVILSIISFFVGGILIFEAPGSKMSLSTGMATPTAFGRFVFKTYWFPVEIASFLLLISLVGTLYLGRRGSKKGSEDKP
jgi:NADH-quinone oxidoreductase subunit J